MFRLNFVMHAQLRVFLGFAALVLLTLSLNGCGKPEPVFPAHPGRSADKLYTARGQIEMLPGSSPTASFMVHHEAIDDFINPGGTKGMNSMTMPLPLEADLSLGGLVVGDKIEFDLAVWYKDNFKEIESFRVIRIKKLPAETELKFGRAAPTL